MLPTHHQIASRSRAIGCEAHCCQLSDQYQVRLAPFKRRCQRLGEIQWATRLTVDTTLPTMPSMDMNELGSSFRREGTDEKDPSGGVAVARSSSGTYDIVESKKQPKLPFVPRHLSVLTFSEDI